MEFDSKDCIEFKRGSCMIKTEVKECEKPDVVKTEMTKHDELQHTSVKTEYVAFEDRYNSEHSTRNDDPKIPVLKKGRRTKLESIDETDVKTEVDISSGKRFILDLLAKSAEKVSAIDDKEKKPKM